VPLSKNIVVAICKKAPATIGMITEIIVDTNKK
jgi:hypothetical protein